MTPKTSPEGHDRLFMDNPNAPRRRLFSPDIRIIYMELFQLADVLLSAPKPPPPPQTNASALCNFTRFTNGGAIHNEGRRCGLSTYPGAIQDTTTPMCLNTTKDGLLRLPESELQARCSEDAQCLGYFVDESARL